MKEHLKLNMTTYWVDYLLSLLSFVVYFGITLATGNPICFVLACIALYRAGAFTHEICHQYKNPKMIWFKEVWTWTMGFLMLQHPLRFAKPHLAHHTTGIFGTEKDPQYPLVRSNWKLSVGIFVVLPWVLPLYNFLVCLGAPHVDKLLYGKVRFSYEEMKHIRYVELVYILLLQLVILFAHQIILPFYFVSVGAWFLSVLRIPLEHSLRSYKITSTVDDQRLDSFTHKHPAYIIVQPVGLRYHKEHHMYPKVPYHNLGPGGVTVD